MSFEKTKELFLTIARTLEQKIPDGKEEEFMASTETMTPRDRLFELVPREMCDEALKEVLALSDDEAFQCVNRVYTRAGLREKMRTPCITFFGHPFWHELFEKANKSDIAKSKRSQKPEG